MCVQHLHTFWISCKLVLTDFLHLLCLRAHYCNPPLLINIYCSLQKTTVIMSFDLIKLFQQSHVLCYGGLPGPKGCRNQVRPALPGILASGWVGLKARIVFTSALLSPAVGISSTGMTVHWSSRPSDVITSVQPSSQPHTPA